MNSRLQSIPKTSVGCWSVDGAKLIFGCIAFCIAVIGLIHVFFGWIENVQADELIVTPSLRLREEVNDNIFMGDANKINDFISTITPNIKLEDKTERFEGSLAAGVDGIAYLDNNEWNALDQHYSASFHQRATESMGISASTGYLTDSRPDRELIETGLLLTNINRKKYNGSAGIDYSITDRAGIGVSYNYGQDDYDEDLLASGRFQDMRAHSAMLTTSYQLTTLERLAVARLSGNFATYRFLGENISSTDYASITVGMDWPITEIWDLTFDVGTNFTRFQSWQYGIEQNRLTKKEMSNTEQGGILKMEVVRRGELSRTRFSIFHDIQPSSARGGTTERTAAKAEFRRRLSYEFDVSASALYILNWATAMEIAASDVNEETFRIEPEIHYRFNREFFLGIGYSYIVSRNRDEHLSRNGNIVFFEVGYNHLIWLD